MIDKIEKLKNDYEISEREIIGMKLFCDNNKNKNIKEIIKAVITEPMLNRKQRVILSFVIGYSIDDFDNNLIKN